MKICSNKIFLINIIATIIALLLLMTQKYIPQVSTTIILLFLNLLIFEFGYWILNEYIKKISKKDIIISASGTFIIFILMASFIIWYLHTEETIYTWDSCVYWIKGINLEKQAYNNLIQMFASVKTTLGSQEYNDMAAVPLIPFIHIFGASFTKYVLYNYILYYSPACIILSLYIVRIVENSKFTPYKYLFAYFITMFFPGLFLPLSNGYLDIVGIAIIGLMLHTVIEWDYTNININTIIKLSILSLLLLLSRRWYAFFIVGFYFAIGVQFIIYEFLFPELKCRKCRNTFINLISIAGICILVLLFLAPEIFSLFLGNDYSNAYQAYKTRTFYNDFYNVIKDFGFILFCFAFLGIIFKIILEIRENKIHKIMCHLMISTVVSFILFEKVQSLGEHHRYLLMPLFLTAIIYFLLKLIDVMKRRKLQYIFVIFIISIYGISFLNSFCNEPHIQTNLLSQIYEPPYIRDDLETVNEMVNYLIAETHNTNKKIYIAIDSEIFSQELLNRSKLPECVDAVPAIIGANIKDTRDGFPSQAFLADYIIISPALYNNQAVISELTRIIENQRDDYYQLVQQNVITDNVPVRIYKKDKAITKSYVDVLQHRLKEIYPDNTFVYHPNYFIALVNINAAKNLEYYSWLNGYILTKSAEENIQIFYQLDKQFKEIEFTVTNWYPDCSIQIKNDDVIVYDELISENGDTKYRFDVTEVGNLKISISSPYEQSINLYNGELK